MNFKLLLRAVRHGELPVHDIKHLYTSKHRNNSKIPNIVYQTWINNFVGKTHLKGIEKFRKLNENFSFNLFTDNEIENFMKDYFYSHPIYQIFSNSLYGPLKTDIWRYCILFINGGWYFDINKGMECPINTLVSDNEEAIITFEKNTIDRFSNWVPNEAVIKRLEHPNAVIVNWGFGFAPGHPILKRVIDNIVTDYPLWKNKKVEDVKNAILLFTGPLMLTRTIWEIIEIMPQVSFKQAGIDFNGYGNCNMTHSWSRYIKLKSYEHEKNKIIVK
jgi:mannosyltransferase OCH1-like enzyme